MPRPLALSGAPGTATDPALQALDAYANVPANRVPFLQLMQSYASTFDDEPIFGASGPMAHPDAADDWRNCYSTSWVNPATGCGGTFWPYLDTLPVRNLLVSGMIEALQRLVASPESTLKTEWTTTPTPTLPLTAPQDTYFQVQAEQVGDVVTFRLVTPEPVQQA